MGDTLEYIDEECMEWAMEIDSLLAEGLSLEKAEGIVGSAPLPDCYEYITEEEQKGEKKDGNIKMD